MKAVVILVVLGGLMTLGITLYRGSQHESDDGRFIAFACGNPSNGTVEVQLAVPYAMTRLDPGLRPADGDPDIPRTNWVTEHFELRDESGERAKLKRAHFANLLPEAKIGTPDYYAVGRIKASGTYTFDYLPLGLYNSKRYRCTFDLTEEGLPFQRANFAYVPEE